MRFYVYQDRAGEWRWRLYAANHRVLADSGEGYLNKQDCIDALNIVATQSGGVPIVYR